MQMKHELQQAHSAQQELAVKQQVSLVTVISFSTTRTGGVHRVSIPIRSEQYAKNISAISCLGSYV